VSKEFVALASIVGDDIGIREESGSNWCQKRLKDYQQMLQYCTLMKMKNKMKDSKA
jgi:hypothetical protein